MKAIKSDNISFEITHIDEEGLLPGTSEPTEISGILPLSHEIPQNITLQFSPIDAQHGLQALHLKSKGVELDYSLSTDLHTLSAQAGKAGPTVFKVVLENDGTYTFTLTEHLDREPPANLLINGNFSAIKNADLNFDKKGIAGWHSQFIQEASNLYQQIPTDPNTSYQLTLLLLPLVMKNIDPHPLHVFWNDQLIHTIDPNLSSTKGFTFTLEGHPEAEHSKLSFVSQDPQSTMIQHLDQVFVASQAQNKCPIDFDYTVIHDNQVISQDHFMVNVTTTPPIELNNHVPFDIFYEQAVYQTIIVSDDSPSQNPLTKINLDVLFNNLAIPAENRHVEVIQREENGHATNVYEVKISDKVEGSKPITVADVQLSFPGGDGGLHVFQRNILIDDGAITPPSIDHII